MEKFGVLFDELEASGPDGMAASRDLWAFLRAGVWRSARGGETEVSGDSTTLAAVRATSLALLGIGLVRDGALGWEFDLEPSEE